MARFLVDANMPGRTAAALREAGYEADDVREMALAEDSDEVIFARAQTDASTVVTRDTDFAELARSSNHPGVILLRLGGMRSEEIISRLIVSCEELDAGNADFSDTIVVIERSRVRIRGPQGTV